MQHLRQVLLAIALGASCIATAADSKWLEVALYFSDAELAVAQDCRATLVMRRAYDSAALGNTSSERAESVLVELLGGPTRSEQLAGAADTFAAIDGSRQYAGRLINQLQRVSLQDEQLDIHFNQRAEAWFSNGSCGTATILVPIQTTLQALTAVNEVRIYVDGQLLSMQ